MSFRIKGRPLHVALALLPLLPPTVCAQTWKSANGNPADAKAKRVADDVSRADGGLDRLDQVDWSSWEDLDGLLRDVHARTGVPAIAAAYVMDGEIVDHATVGVIAFGENDPVGPNDPFHLGSVTKSITATLIGTLVVDGTLTWDTQVGDILTDVDMLDAYRTVTIEQLLQHRGGLSSYTHGRPEGHDPDARYTGTPTEQRAQFLADVLRIAPAGTPGETFLYSNAGYALVGSMAERVTGQSYESLVRQRIFDPLGMDHSGFGFPERPLGHVVDGAAYVPVPLSGYPQMEIIAPAGNVHSSVTDLARYAIAHLAGLEGEDGAVPSEVIQRLHTPLPGAGASDYASGWRIGRDASGEPVHAHGGTVGASFAEIRLYPATRGGVVFLTNVPMGVGEAIANQVTRALRARYAPATTGFVASKEAPKGITVLKDGATADDDARFWRIVTAISKAINDEDRDAFRAMFAPSYDLASADSLFDFMAGSVLPARGGIYAFHAANPPFRVDGAATSTRTVTIHLENGFPGYIGIQLDQDEKLTELSLFVKSDLCPNGADRRCDRITKTLGGDR